MDPHRARLESKITFEDILQRIRNPRLKDEVNWLRSSFIHGFKGMPIAFDVV
jgi:cytochrome P450